MTQVSPILVVWFGWCLKAHPPLFLPIICGVVPPFPELRVSKGHRLWGRGQGQGQVVASFLFSGMDIF